MYEDAWYTFDFQQKRNPSQSHGHKRKESLLQQPDGNNVPGNVPQQLEQLFEEDADPDTPAEATVAPRARSYSDLYDIVRVQLAQDAKNKREGRRKRDRSWAALAVQGPEESVQSINVPIFDLVQDDLLDESQQEYSLYRDQLALTERHLDTLIQDTNGALELLASLGESFRTVEAQTTSFKSQCDDLLSEQKRLQNLAEEVGTDLYYYSYLDNVTRRLNGPGASRLIDNDVFQEILTNLDACIEFMARNPTYRDADSYLARYQSLLTKALHLLEVGFSSRLDKISSEISRQIAATKSESARHALAYGRFEEMMLDSYSLLPNIQMVLLHAYDEYGNPKSGQSVDIYSNTAKSILLVYLAARDGALKPIIQMEVEGFKSETKDSSAESASRNFVKQCFERSYNEGQLLTKLFAIEPQYSTNASSAFTAIRSHRSDLVNGFNVVPIATQLQSVLVPADLQAICNVLGWMTHEYLLFDYDEEETPVARHCRELTARVLAEHLWAFTDAAFEAEIAKSITRAPVNPEALKIGPVVDGIASSNAYPPVKRAVELLGMFDQSMPKERCQRNSPVIFKLVREAIQALQRAESRLRSIKSNTDADLFMIKNLLILKNELVSLEIGDIRSHEAGMQHFSQIWDALSVAQNLVGYFSSFIPGSSYWSRGSPAPGGGGAAKTGTAAAAPEQQDASDQLDELLRKSIYAFTQRWGDLINEATGRQLGGRNLVKAEKELEDMLQNAFSNQPEVIAKLKEAIQLHAQAQREQKGSKITRI